MKPSAEGVLQFVRAAVVGSGATIVDFLTLTTCLRVLGVAPSVARIPALTAGAFVQFFGHRSFTFRAAGGAISRQAKRFIAVEVVGVGLNFAIYQALLTRLRGVPPEGLGLLGSFLAFIGFVYPMHRLVTFASPSIHDGSV